MKIPLPCKFGELSDCDGKLLRGFESLQARCGGYSAVG